MRYHTHMEKEAAKNLLIAVAVSLGAALIVAVAVLLAGNTSFDPQNPSPGISERSVVILASIPLLVVWGGAAFFRCSDQAIRKYLFEIVALVIAWQIIVAVRYTFYGADNVSAFMWYLYYVGLCFIPALFLLMSLHTTGLNRHPRYPAIKHAVLIASSLALALVLTNNLHQLVFVIDFDNPQWAGTYHYNFGYFLVAGLQVALYLTAFAALCIRSHRNYRRMLPLIIGVLLLGLAYCVLYCFRVAILFNGNFSLSYAFFVVGVLELCIQSGFIPSYKKFSEVFAKLPFDLVIASDDGTTTFSTESAQGKDPEEQEYLFKVAQRSMNGPSSAFSVSSQPNQRFQAFRLNGGYAILSENISSIVSNQKLLAQNTQRLRRQNALLEQDSIARKTLRSQTLKKELYAEIRQTLSGTIDRIRHLLDTLPGTSTPEEAAQRKLQLMQVKMLIAYCKRKGSIILSKTDDPDFDRERLLLVTNETASDLRVAGIECASLIETDAPLPATTVSILYDCFYDFCMAAFNFTEPAIMFYLHNSSTVANAVEMRLMLESEGPATHGNDEALEALRATLEQRNVAFRLMSDEESLLLTVVAEKGAQ